MLPRLGQKPRSIPKTASAAKLFGVLKAWKQKRGAALEQLSDEEKASLMRAAFRYVAIFLAFATAVIGAVVLLGWSLNADELKSIFPGQVPMKANTAISLILISLALLITIDKRAGVRWKRVSQIFVAVVVLISLVTLCEY